LKKVQRPSRAKVKGPGTEDEMVQLSELSHYGAVVNAYEALKLAATLKTPEKTKLPKSSMKKNKKG
jgi:hypothetical protein